MNPALDLLRASASGQSGLEAFLQTHELTPELASAVRELFIGFINTDQFENAELAASVLALLWLRLGNPQEMFRNHIDHLQLRFKHADTPASYAALRAQALDALSKVIELEEHEFAFRLAVLAADASYFGHKVGGQAIGLSVPLVLADLVAAAHRARTATSSTWFPRFVSLLAAAVQEAMSQQLPNEERDNADRSLRLLATEGKTLIPPGFKFPDDPNKTSQLTALLRRLTHRHGR